MDSQHGSFIHFCGRDSSLGVGLEFYTLLPTRASPGPTPARRCIVLWDCITPCPRAGSILGSPWSTKGHSSEMLEQQFLIRKLGRPHLGLLDLEPWFRSWSRFVRRWVVRCRHRRGILRSLLSRGSTTRFQPTYAHAWKSMQGSMLCCLSTCLHHCLSSKCCWMCFNCKLFYNMYYQKATGKLRVPSCTDRLGNRSHCIQWSFPQDKNAQHDTVNIIRKLLWLAYLHTLLWLYVG